MEKVAEYKHLRVKKEIHDKALILKGMMATDGKFVSIQTIIKDLLDAKIKELESKK